MDFLANRKLNNSMQYDIQLPAYSVELVTLDAGQVIDWGHKALKATKYYPRSRGENAIGFILDTAGKFTHPDLIENAIPEYDYNVTSDPDEDGHGHGTHCAGIAGAVDNKVGVIGIAPRMGLVAVKVLNDQGSGTFANVARGIRYVADLRLTGKHEGKKKILSLSLGGGPGTPTPRDIDEAIRYAVDKGCFIVVSAGNWGAKTDGRSRVGPPGNHPLVISVASSDKPGDVASSFSSEGEEVDLMAPGSLIYSTHKNGGYVRLSGTSMACPQVTGIAALILSDRPTIKNQGELKKFVEQNATDILGEGFDERSGWGAPILTGYMDNDPKPGPDPDPEPPRPVPGPGPEPDPDIPPQRGRGVAEIPYSFEGETYSILYRKTGSNEPMKVGLVSGLQIISVNNIDALVMGRILQGYLRDFFHNRAIIVPPTFDEYDVAVYTGVFLKLIADDAWVLKKYKTKLKLRVDALEFQVGNVRIRVSEREIENRLAEMEIDPPGIAMVVRK